MSYNLSINPNFTTSCFRHLFLKKYPFFSAFSEVNQIEVDNYINKVYQKPAVAFVETNKADTSGNLKYNPDYLYTSSSSIMMQQELLFSCSQYAETLLNLSHFFQLSDSLPYDFSLYCLHNLLLTGFSDASIQDALPLQIYKMNDISQLRFLSRFDATIRLNILSEVSMMA